MTLRRRLRRWTVWMLGFLTAATVLLGAWGLWAYSRYIIDAPGVYTAHISEDAIKAIISRESPVLYRDGRTPIGVFFAEEHRHYVHHEELPQDWIDAIVAAEDKHFFSHYGVDPEGIARAMVQNIRAGRVVSGGSTLTQQTAKNLYYRPDRSLRSKWEEMVNALRLEHRHSKDEILEYYANQFHVSANGRGLGVGARYFFNKPVADLDLLECAFLAGMVKGPANYDPFIARSVERQQRARARAKTRIGYVLQRMLITDKIDRVEHEALMAELDARFEEGRFFNRGQFRYDTNVLLDEVNARLSEAPFPELFEALNIDNISTAGIQIVTTIDEDAQRSSTYALWHHLSEVGPVLEAAGAASLRLPDEAAPSVDLTTPPVVHEFYPGQVRLSSVEEIIVDLGGHHCTVDVEGIDRMAAVLARAEKGERWRRASKKHRVAITDALPVGATTWVSVRGDGICDLELRPELQGGAMVLDRGRIRAMVGGNDNRNFNRAVTARRQFGSTWKPVIYAAAMQLNWQPTDRLDNREGGFPFEGVWYFPRAAHRAPPVMSLAGSGPASENLASVWLLYHLTDRLSPRAFDEVASLVGMAQAETESDRDYLLRIRDDNGVISTRARYAEFAWSAERLALVRDLEAAEPDLALALQSLLYGRTAEAEANRTRRRFGGATEARRLKAIRYNRGRLAPLAEQCAQQADRLIAFSARAQDAKAAASAPDRRPRWPFRSSPRLSPGTAASIEMLTPIEELPPLEDFSALRIISPAEAVEDAGVPQAVIGCAEDEVEGWRPLMALDLEALGRAQMVLSNKTVADISIEDRLTVGVVRRLEGNAKRREAVMQGADPYSPEVLRFHPDYRLLVGIRYVSTMAHRLGVSTPLRPVLSMPLGAAEISLEEAALLYQGLLTGETHRYPGLERMPMVGGLWSSEEVADQSRSTQLIVQIRDQNGEVRYRAGLEGDAVVDPVAGRLTGGILRNVVRAGTGRRAEGAVRVDDIPVPMFGKTGTTNSFRNAAFVGVAPIWRDEGWRWEDALTVAVYVGYDDNREMIRGSTRLAGASGALPAWIGIYQGLARAGLLGRPVERAEWNPGDHYAWVPVDEAGLPVAPDADAAGQVLVWGETGDEPGAVRSRRRFAPTRPSEEAPPLPDDQPLASDDREQDLDLEEIWIPEMGDPDAPRRISP
ncbi:MAG: transglycosylase domain-containing protein [Myxococcota bacterium]